MRILRRDDMDTWERTSPDTRDDRLRELVDALPVKKRHLVSRVFFGGAPLAHAAAEIRMDVPEARTALTQALEVLYGSLQETD